MSEKQTGIMTSESFCQIGIVVKNIDETIAYYEKAFGFGPFEVRYVDYPWLPITVRWPAIAARELSSILGPFR